jgi:hypothetical protein
MKIKPCRAAKAIINYLTNPINPKINSKIAMKYIRKNYSILFISSVIAFLFASCKQENRQTITLETLLDEMVSYEESARFPLVPYLCQQESSYDRRSIHPDSAGWFANNDGFGIIRTDTINGRTENVLFDREGPGVITRIWLTTLNKQGIMRFYFDNSSEAQWTIPAYDLMQTGLSLGKGLLQPHTSYTPDGKGGNTLFLPIPYAKACKITFEQADSVKPTPKYYQINYRKYPAGTDIKTFTLQDAEKLKDKLNTTSEILLHPVTYDKGDKIELTKEINPQKSLDIDLPKGNKAIYSLLFDIQTDSANYEQIMRQLVLQISFDGKQTVFVPLGDFSAGGMGARETESWFLSSDGKGKITSRWIMPYQKEGTLRLLNVSPHNVNASVTLYANDLKWDKRSLYFHTSWKQEIGLKLSNNPDNNAECSDWNFALLTNGRGIYKGDVLSLFNHSPTWYGEGDEKIYVDNDVFPSHFGTGTEDYYNSSWAPVIPFQTPFGGAPRADLESSHGYNTFFRTRNLDGIPFNNKLQFDLELLSWIPGTADYSCTVYWYGDMNTVAERTSSVEEVLRPLLPAPEAPVKYKASEDAVEFELLKPADKSPNITADEQNMAGFTSDKWSNEKQTLLTGGKPGEYVTYRFDVPQEQESQLLIYLTKAADYGIIGFKVNGKELPMKFDAYGKEVKNSGPVDLGSFKPENGKIELRVEILGTNKNSVGNGYFVGLDCIRIVPVK